MAIAMSAQHDTETSSDIMPSYANLSLLRKPVRSGDSVPTSQSDVE